MKSTKEIQTALSRELAKSQPDPKRIAELSDALLDTAEDAVRFTVDAQHINRLGLELVGKQETALSELIKNAYDADATEVTIQFEAFDEPGGELVISDNGVGMDLETIRNAWMRLSTNAKGDNPVSELFKRRRAGRKGIGRFAVQRLGKSLILESAQKGKSTGLRVSFQWDKNFQAGVDLNQVWHEVHTFEKDPNNFGTTLKIGDLRDRWTKATITRVWKSVLFLQPPFQTDEIGQRSDGFNVTINGISSGQQRTEWNIEENFLNNAVAKVTGSIDKDGVATFRVTSEKLGIDETHRSENEYYVVGPVSLEASYFIYLSTFMSGMSVKIAQEMGHKYGGVRVYRNGFRVLPYGEPNDDWLKLSYDSARRNLLVPANNFNFFGHVSVSEEGNPSLEETSSREGFVENNAFEELHLFSRRCVEWAATRVASVRKRKTTASQQDFEPTYTRKPSEFVLERLANEQKDKDPDNSGQGADGAGSDQRGEEERAASNAAFLEELYRKQKEYEEQTDEKIELSLEYENMLRILASLGISISLFGHEIKSATNAVDNSLAVAEIDAESLKDDTERKQLEADLSSLKSATDRMFDLGSYVEALVSKTRSRELTEVHIDTAVKRFLGQFQSYLQKRHIDFEVDINPIDLRTPKMHASELDSVLFNFLTNSVKAIDKANSNNPMIRVEGRDEGGFVKLSFEDNGIGIDSGIGDRVFDAFFTTTETDGDSISGIGTGLGLKIVNDIALAYGGDATLSDNATSGYTTRFEFRLKKAIDS
ncbi:sensor histidine kinase [Phaeobacter italicus]|uniref:sensor histidine kinase n=1 Tax=Phaeobacter italicus TaxID=481446 RepID=UPI001ADBD143|nr:sensor histidine kinase [Phaeobacter italicus]MBO9441267.1 sensor histidine kinase [Phaeobacter italicus]